MQRLRAWERKVLRKIFGIRTNQKTYDIKVKCNLSIFKIQITWKVYILDTNYKLHWKWVFLIQNTKVSKICILNTNLVFLRLPISGDSPFPWRVVPLNIFPSFSRSLRRVPRYQGFFNTSLSLSLSLSLIHFWRNNRNLPADDSLSRQFPSLRYYNWFLESFFIKNIRVFKLTII